MVLPQLNEVQRRVVAGAAAEMFGRGVKTAVATASGMSRNTVIKAETEVAAGIVPSDRLRAVGGGDKPSIDQQKVACSTISTANRSPPSALTQPAVSIYSERRETPSRHAVLESASSSPSVDDPTKAHFGAPLSSRNGLATFGDDSVEEAR